MAEDRRRIPRVPVFFILERLSLPFGEAGQKCQGVVKNITPDGLLLETSAELSKHDTLQISFTLPNTHKTLNLEARVCWVEKNKAWSTSGTAFMDLSAEQKEFIMDYLLTLGPPIG